MDKEILQTLLRDPAQLPYFLILAIIAILIYRVITALVDMAVKHLQEKIENKRGLISVIKATAQVIAMALVFYVGNALYWERNIDTLIPPPHEKPIVTFQAMVDLILPSNETENAHFMDSGCFLALKQGTNYLLIATSGDSWAMPLTNGQQLCRGEVKMSSDSSAFGQPVKILRETQSAEIGFGHLPESYTIITGKVVCIINSDIRLEFGIPSQQAKERTVVQTDLTAIRESLK